MRISEKLFEYIKNVYPGLAEEIERENHQQGEVSRYISKEDRYKVLQRQKWNCNQCGCKLKYSIHNEWEGEVAHIDHIHPFTEKESYLNGEWNINELSNLQGLCPKCNLSKGGKEIQ